MIKNENIICISSIDWDFVWQGHQEVMSAFAKNGNRVLFIENTGVRAPGIRDISRIKVRIKNWFRGVKGIRKEMENLYVFSPVVLPFPYSRIARFINKHLILSVLGKWKKVMDFTDPIIWTFLPTGLAADLIDSLDKKMVVYYCIADFEKLVANPKKVRNTEKAVIERSDLVFAQGSEIKKHCEKYNKNIFVFPFGVNIEKFVNYDDRGITPPDFPDVSGPVIGYVGGIHKHVDFDLIRYLAEQNPRWNFIFIGPLQEDISPVRDLKNIWFLDIKKHKDLPAYVSRFDVCLVPYLLNEYTKTVYPTKLNEYLAMGKPVVSTALPEVSAFNEEYGNIVYTAKDNMDFEDKIKKALSDKCAELVKKRIEAAMDNSWDSRIEDMSGLIQEVSDRKKKNTEMKWKENLLMFYKTARKKVFKFTVIFFMSYLVLFKTSLLWFFAEPLKIADNPSQVDAIVVFGGGVGETGNPGKSTIERARCAAELYKKGYANKIIFSSGYTYVYNDAENMALIAMSDGVPRDDIILEQKANSAYENVIHTSYILKRNKWSSLIVVSSAYNMRRISLTCERHLRDKKILYVPVRNSQFYRHGHSMNFEQFLGIAHEYMGIVYYWIKGWI